MIVKNNEARLINIGAFKGGKEISLAPGNNEVDDADWQEAQKIKLVQHYLSPKVKTLVVVRKVEGAKAGDPEALRTLSPAQAAKLVGETLHLGTLRRWAEGEKREAVLKAIAMQVEFVNEQTKIKEDDDEGEGKPAAEG